MRAFTCVWQSPCLLGVSGPRQAPHMQPRIVPQQSLGLHLGPKLVQASASMSSFAVLEKGEGFHLGFAVVRGLRVRGSTIWLASSSSTTSKECPSSTGSPAEQQVTPTTAALFSLLRRCLSAPCILIHQQSLKMVNPSATDRHRWDKRLMVRSKTQLPPQQHSLLMPLLTVSIECTAGYQKQFCTHVTLSIDIASAFALSLCLALRG